MKKTFVVMTALLSAMSITVLLRGSHDDLQKVLYGGVSLDSCTVLSHKMGEKLLFGTPEEYWLIESKDRVPLPLSAIAADAGDQDWLANIVIPQNADMYKNVRVTWGKGYRAAIHDDSVYLVMSDNGRYAFIYRQGH